MISLRTVYAALALPLLLASGASAASAQNAAFSDTVDVRVANVEVFVTDERGHPVTGLGPGAFQLFVDGEEVPILNFYAEVDGRPEVVLLGEVGAEITAPGTAAAELPPAEQRLHLVILVDNGNLDAPNRQRAFEAVRRFLDAHLGPGDAATVVSLGDILHIHSDFLADRGALDAVLDKVQRSSARASAIAFEQRHILSELTRRSTDNRVPEGVPEELLARIRAYAQGEFHRGEVTLEAMTRLIGSLAGIPGRKALLYISDGIPRKPGEEVFTAWQGIFGSVENDYERQVGYFDLLPKFLDVARRANAGGVTFYALDAEGDHTSAIRSAEVEGPVASTALSVAEANFRDPLEVAAQATGGMRFQASTHLARDLERLIVDFDSFYSLGFEATVPGGTGTATQEIRVETRDRNLRVRHRESYEAKTPELRMGEATVAALLYHTVDNPLDVSLAPGEPAARQDGNAVVPVEVRVPLESIGLLPQGESLDGQLSLYVSVKDERGNPGPVQKLPFHLRVPADQRDEALRHSATYTLPLVVRPGDTQVAISVRDDIAAIGSTLRLDLPQIPGGEG